MSTVEKVTTDRADVPEKIKNPKRVEAGKKLAMISKATKEKKMRDMIKMEKSLSENGNNTLYIVTIVISILMVIYLVFTVFLKRSEKKVGTLPEERSEIPKMRRNVLENL